MAQFGKLNFAVAFNPQTAFPLDARSYFEDYDLAFAAAQTAAVAGDTNTVYYFGQTLVVNENNVATLYIIQPDKTLKEVGSVPVGDGKSIEVVDGEIQLKGFGTHYYKYVAETTNEEGETVPSSYVLTEGFKAGLEPKVVSGLVDGQTVYSIGWYEPNPTTIEGLSATITALDGRVGSLEETVGDADKGLVKDLNDLDEQINGEDGQGGLAKTVADHTNSIQALNDTVGDATKGLVKDVTTIKTAIGIVDGEELPENPVFDRLTTLETDLNTLELAVGQSKGQDENGNETAATGLFEDIEKLTADVATADTKAQNALNSIGDINPKIASLIKEVYGDDVTVIPTEDGTSRIDILEADVYHETTGLSTRAAQKDFEELYNDVHNTILGEATVSGSIAEAKLAAENAANSAKAAHDLIGDSDSPAEGTILDRLNDIEAEIGDTATADTILYNINDIKANIIGTSEKEGSIKYDIDQIKEAIGDKTSPAEGTIRSDIKAHATAISALQNAVTGVLKREVVETLPSPETANEHTIYMMPITSTEDDNVYAEYIVVTVDGAKKWEELGDTHISLEGYATEEFVGNAIKAYDEETLAGKYVDKTTYETHVAEIDGELGTRPAAPEGGTQPNVWGRIAELEAKKLDATAQVVQSVNNVDFTLTNGELSINKSTVFVLNGGNAASFATNNEAE